jgi:hypothetical protein
MGRWIDDKRNREELQYNPAVNPKMRETLQDFVETISWSSSSSSSSSSSLSSSSSSLSSSSSSSSA